MKKSLSLLAALCSMSFSSAYALDCCVADWEVTAEFLYLAPTFDDTYFVIKSQASSTANIIGQRDFNTVGFQPGFRIGGALDLDDCGRELQIYYTRLRADHNKTVAGDFLWATQGRADFASSFENYAGTAHSYLDALYQRIDANVVQMACCNGGLSVSFQAGLEWAYLNVVENLTYISTTTGFVNQESKIWGIGPQVGFVLGYHLWTNCCSCPGTLSFVARTSASLLASSDQAKVLNQLSGVDILSVHNAQIWRVIPALHTRLGFNYLTQISCYEAAFEIGYEFDSYIRGYTRAAYPDDVGDGLSYNSFYDFDLQGLYVSGTFKY